MTYTNDSLNNPVWQALTHQQAALALGDDLARCYPRDIAPFGAVAASSHEAFDSLAALIAPDATVALVGGQAPTGDRWTLLRQVSLIQMVYDGPVIEAAETPCTTQALAPADVPAMIELVEMTHPGPFLPRTIELGLYLGICQEGRLAAMAGARLHLPGYREISAVCTHPSFQRRGYARQLVLQLIHEIQSAGDLPFLHVVGGNTGAEALYETLGFKRRAELPLLILKRQADASA